MASIGMSVDISPLVDATAAGDTTQVIEITRHLLEQGAAGDELIGRVGMVAAHGDSDGHPIITLDAASMMCRWQVSLQHLLGEDPMRHERELPLIVQSLVSTAPAIQAGKSAQISYPEPLFPSGMPEGKSVGDMMHEAIYNNDPELIERLLLGLYGTGADYRTMQIRTYDGISTTFQNDGHPLMFAVRGTQLLDAVEWGMRAPNILQWLTPYLPLHTAEPSWVKMIRDFLSEPSHSLDSYRTRLSAPKNENALPLRGLILSDTGTPQICQAVYDALIKQGASSHGIASVIALTAADVLHTISDGDRQEFIRVAHGLLFAAAVRLVFSEIQDIEALPLLFTSASYINVLHKELAGQGNAPSPTNLRSSTLGGGLIAAALLDTLREQVDAQDLAGAFSTARRYIQLGHDTRALFATLALEAAKADAAVDQGHTLQIAQAAGEEFMGWPADLANTNIEAFLYAALRAVVFPKRDTLVTNLNVVGFQ